MYQKRGFTLIELLVVVLIIGILSAVALPQYQVAVEKARLARVMSNVKTIKNSAELYYLANGKYEDDLRVMDIGGISGCTTKTGGQIHCSDEWYDWKYTNTDAGWAAIGHTMPYGKYRTGFLIYGDYNSQSPGTYECWAKTSDPVAVRVCKSFGGVKLREDRCRPVEANIGACAVFRLP